MSTKVYKFWCEPSDETSRETLRDQFGLMRNYRFGLARLENLRREEGMVHAAQDPEFSESYLAEQSLFDVDKEDRDDDWSAELEKCRTRRKSAYDAIKNEDWLKELRAKDFADQREYQRLINVGLGPKGQGLSFATGQFCADSHKQAVEKTAIYKRIHVDLKPSEGVFAVHYQDQGKTTYSSLTDDTRSLVKIAAMKSGLTRRSGRTGAPRLNKVTLQISKGKSLSVHVLLHRDIPKDAVITWVRVHCVTVATKKRYSLQIVATHNTTAQTNSSTKSVAVDLGFRKTETGYIVATARGSDGAEHELVIPHSVTDRGLDRKGKTAKCSDLRAIRDLRFNDLKKILVPYLPEASRWRSPGRLGRVLKDGNLPEEILTHVSQEFKKDRHLWDWEASNRTKMVRQISGRYQEFAAFLAKEYSEIRMEDLKICQAKEDWREKATLEGKDSVADQRSVLKLGYLQKAIQDRASSFGTSVGVVKAAYTSMDCSSCGTRGLASASKVLVCSSCGLEEDRDIRACKNIASSHVQKWITGPLAAVKSTKRKVPRKKVIDVACPNP